MLHVASQILITSLNFMLAPPAPLVYLTLTYSIFMIEYEIGIFSKNMNPKEAFYKVMSAAAVVAALTGCNGENGTSSAVNATPLPTTIPGTLLGCKHADQGDSLSGIAEELKAGSNDRAYKKGQ